MVQAEFTLVVLIACGISSLRPIPPRRYARVTGLSSLRGAIRTLSCTRFFFFCLVYGLEQQRHQLNIHCLLRKRTVNMSHRFLLRSPSTFVSKTVASVRSARFSRNVGHRFEKTTFSYFFFALPVRETKRSTHNCWYFFVLFFIKKL